MNIKHQSYPKPRKLDAFEQKNMQCHSPGKNWVFIFFISLIWMKKKWLNKFRELLKYFDCNHFIHACIIWIIKFSLQFIFQFVVYFFILVCSLFYCEVTFQWLSLYMSIKCTEAANGQCSCFLTLRKYVTLRERETEALLSANLFWH